MQISIAGNDRVFVLAGAGISAESGVPTFRDAGGLWRTHRIEEVASPVAWRRDPRLVWDFYSMRRRVAAKAKPNAGHEALAKLERSLGERLFLCTQNVDDLHEQAGSQRVIHMHGELFKSRCDSCAKAPFSDRNGCEAAGPLPLCECGAKIRPHICWFGEIPFAMDRIVLGLEQCTVFVAVGTSGVVQPAASFVAACRGRARTFYVGPEAPANECEFDEWFSGKAAEVLPNLFVVERSVVSGLG